MSELYFEFRYESGTVPGFDVLSDDFCNLPVCVDQQWREDGPVAAILLCGHLRNHYDGDCGPIPPLSAVQGDVL